MKRIYIPVAVVGALVLAHFTSRLLISRISNCGQPCRWDSDSGFGNCEPLALHIDIKTSAEPRGGGTAVWYEASATNNSCDDIEIPSDFFIDNKTFEHAINQRKGAFVAVTDSSGAPMRPSENIAPPAHGIHSTEDEIHPYSRDISNLMPLLKIESFPSDPAFNPEFVTIKPGATIVASPSLLAPYRLVSREIESPGAIGTTLVPQKVESPAVTARYAAPPSGYRKLKEYTSLKPGRYGAEFRISELILLRPADGSRSTFDMLVRRVIYFLALAPSPTDRRWAEINATSNTTFFALQ